eukprot:CAMPEP_0203658458 /NCGR_PEP_ID=MMETSP0088-20131115/48263_1 /ASSEMBLY_ACC=CAM_ASM_001087 /TAXON_ID=426623 /ORGANISM="Chaetoceros affinis, Strain CCMP159" /LENGTH=59 /DNA_ID=CAMNT_0050520131 /DNA_START=190 /DNA_END=369 /DNA_ORIENTATION=-
MHGLLGGDSDDDDEEDDDFEEEEEGDEGGVDFLFGLFELNDDIDDDDIGSSPLLFFRFI